MAFQICIFHNDGIFLKNKVFPSKITLFTYENDGNLSCFVKFPSFK